MELARVLGNVVCTVKDPSIVGFKLLIIQPVDETDTPTSDPLIAIDPLQAGPGDLVAWIKGREASLAIPHELSPVDAAIVQMVDSVNASKPGPGEDTVPWAPAADTKEAQS